jgi:hypothetical protein
MFRSLKAFSSLISIALVLAALFVVWKNWQNAELVLSLKNLHEFSPILLAVIFLLSPVNWMLESKKWQILSGIESKKAAHRSVLRGISLSLLTPNRIGEVIGRVHKSGKNKMQHGLAFLVGSLAQSTITVAFGLVGLLYFSLPPSLNSDKVYTISALALIGLLSSTLLLGAMVEKWVKFIPLPGKWRNHATALKKIALSKQAAALGFSFLRYVIFSSQFVIALKVFGADQELITLYSGVALSYLFSSFIPASIVGELGVRESVAVLVFASICPPQVVLPATFIVWFVNLAFPGLLGSLEWSMDRFSLKRST